MLLEARGLGQFDDASLIQALASPPLDAQTWCPMNSGLLDEYNQFYSLQFPGIDRDLALVESNGERITIQTFAPNDREIQAWAVVCHGYYDHVGLYGHLIKDLLLRDIAVVTFDQPGHGLSSGDRANIGCRDSTACDAATGKAQVMPPQIISENQNDVGRAVARCPSFRVGAHLPRNLLKRPHLDALVHQQADSLERNGFSVCLAN